MSVDSPIRTHRFSDARVLSCDAYSTCFAAPTYNPMLQVFNLLAGRGFNVRMDDTNRRQFWSVYEKYRDLDYVGAFSGRDRWAALFEELDIQFSDSLVPLLNRAEFDAHGHNVTTFPFALETLSRARARGLMLSLCTTANEIGWLFEQLLGLPGYFHTIALSREQNRDKKVPKGGTIQDTLFARLPDITGFEPHEIVVMEDNPAYLSTCSELGYGTILVYEGQNVGAWGPKWESDFGNVIDAIVPWRLVPECFPQFQN